AVQKHFFSLGPRRSCSDDSRQLADRSLRPTALDLFIDGCQAQNLLNSHTTSVRPGTQQTHAIGLKSPRSPAHACPLDRRTAGVIRGFSNGLHMGVGGINYSYRYDDEERTRCCVQLE